MLKALHDMLKGDIIEKNTKEIKYMGTQQALTTEQVNVLSMLDTMVIETYENELYEKLWNEYDLSGDEVDEALEALERYGYIYEDRSLTTDGKQFLQLNLEHYEKKIKNTNNIKKESKKSNLKYWVEILGGIIAAITAVVTTIIAICNAVNK